MTPVLAVPVINRPDLLARFIASIDIPVRLLVIDNSGAGIAHDVVPDDAWLLEPPGNLGVSASWNLTVKCYPHEPYWLIANADTELGPGDLSGLVRATESGDRGWVGINGDMRIFGWTRAAVEVVGLFDENFHPAFVEDADYERRCDLAGIRWGFIEGTTTHVGSTSLEDHGQANARTWPENVRYHIRKWGVGVRQPGGFATPFDKGGSVADWTLEPRRLRAQSWHRDGRAR